MGYLSFTPSQVKLWSQQTSSHRDCSGTARGLGWPCTRSTLVSDGFQLSAIQVLNSSTEILPTVTMVVLESCLPPGMCKDAPKWPELHVTQSWRGCWMFQWPCAKNYCKTIVDVIYLYVSICALHLNGSLLRLFRPDWNIQPYQ